MALVYDAEIKNHLKLLISAPSQVLVDFCRLALDYIKNGPNTKRYQIAAQKLETSSQDIENAVTAIVKLLVDGSKYSVSSEAFTETVSLLGFSLEQQEVLAQCYEARGTQVRRTLEGLPSPLPTYRDLHWRLEAQVASRSVPTQVCPNVMMNLQLQTSTMPSVSSSAPSGDSVNKSPDKSTVGPTVTIDSIPLQCDLPNLVYLIGQLETALRESKTFHIRRMHRVLQQA